MDELTHDKLECIDRKLTQICSRQEKLILDINELKIETELNKNNLSNQQKTARIVIRVAWTLFGIIGLMAGYIVKQQVNFDNSSDVTQQQEINSINERLIKVEVLNGSIRQP